MKPSQMKPSFRRALMLCDSPNPTERESVRLGTLLDDGSPLLVHKKSLSEHVYIRGAPGSGKSAALAYLIELLISIGGCILHLFDLKDQNSMELFAAMRIGARRSGTKVKWFVDHDGKSTHTFNLFLQSFWRRSRPMQKAALVGAALGTTHGLDGYGPKFFGGVGFEFLVTVFEHFEIVSWVDLLHKIKLVRANAVAFGLDREMKKAGTELVNDVARLARIPPLNTPWSSIDLSSEEPQAIYWSFPGAYDMTGVVSRVGLISIFASVDNTRNDTQKWVILDEFQKCIGENLSLLFQQGREKIGLILANQCLADLQTRDKDYVSTIKTCCRIHWTFNASDESEQLFMSEVSGKAISKITSSSYTESTKSSSTSMGFQEVEVNRLGFNEISIANALPELSIFRCTQDYGFVQYLGFPQVVHTEFHIDADEYARRKLMPWPNAEDDPEQGTIEGVMPPLRELPATLAPNALNAPNIVNPGKLPRRAPRNPPPPQ